MRIHLLGLLYIKKCHKNWQEGAVKKASWIGWDAIAEAGLTAFISEGEV